MKKDISLDELIVKCGIPGIGAETARKLALRVRNATTLRDLIEEGQLAAAFEEVAGINEKTKTSLVTYLTNIDFLLLLEEMEEEGYSIFNKDFQILTVEDLDNVPMCEEVVYDDLPIDLSGLTISIAGTLSLPRRMFQEMISKKGGKFSSNVDANVDILVFSDIDGTKSARYKIAEKLNRKGAGINLISEATFIDKFSTKIK